LLQTHFHSTDHLYKKLTLPLHSGRILHILTVLAFDETEKIVTLPSSNNSCKLDVWQGTWIAMVTNSLQTFLWAVVVLKRGVQFGWNRYHRCYGLGWNRYRRWLGWSRYRNSVETDTVVQGLCCNVVCSMSYDYRPGCVRIRLWYDVCPHRDTS